MERIKGSQVMIKDAQEFVKLRTSEDPLEYNRAAQEEADISVWKDLLENYKDFRGSVALNKTLPDEIIRTLSKDEDSNIRYTIAMKRKCPHDVMANLAKDENDAVRKAIAMNKKTSKDILKTMLDDKWDKIVEVVTRRLG